MPSIEILSTYAQTAIAAYAEGLRPGYVNADAFKSMRVGMSTVQADTFNTEWQVLQQSAPNADGFSAVLLQSKSSGEKVLAIAGTDPKSPADWLADLVSVAQYGTVLGMPQYASLEAFYAELVSTGKLGASEALTVTGHSLGGFLAQAFTARHSDVVSAAYTYNAPGFSGIEELLGFLGVTDPGAAGKITNVPATDGISMTAGLGAMLGESHPVRIKANANPLVNHSIIALGDAVVVLHMVFIDLASNAEEFACAA